MNNNDNWERDYTIEGEEPVKPSKHPFAKEFFTVYAYDSVKMFVDQIAIALFGMAVTLALANSGDVAIIAASSFSVLFYLFLIYIVGWQQGSKDRISIDLGKKKFRIKVPILTVLLANSLNFLLAVIVTVGHFAKLEDLEKIGNVAALLIEGMYAGLMRIEYAAERSFSQLWYTYFIITIPAMLVGVIAYILGTKNKKLTNILTPPMPKTDRPEKK